MKKIELGCLALSFILIILLICSLRSNWEKITVKLDRIENEVIFERDIYSTEKIVNFMVYNKNEKNPNGTNVPIEFRYSTSNSTHSINAFGALAIIFLFFNIINLFKINIKFITSNIYSKLEKISIVFTGLLVLFAIFSTFIAFGLKVDVCFEPKTNKEVPFLLNNNDNVDASSSSLLPSEEMQCFQSRFIEELKLPTITFEYNLTIITLTGGILRSSATSGFYLMLICLISSIVYAIISGFRYKEVRSPSSSIDYRFLYNGEDSSFLNDDDADEFDDSTL